MQLKRKGVRIIKARKKADKLERLAFILCDEARYEEAINVIETALDMYPQFASGWATIGLANESMGDIQNAIAAYMEAISMDRKSTRAHMGLSRLFRSIGLNILANDEIDYAELERDMCLN